MHGLHRNINLNSMVVGHTKFAPDWCFGLLKQKYSPEDVSLVSGGHRPADQQQHDNGSEPGPAGRHRGADREHLPLQLADVPGRGLPTTERHQAVPTLPVSTTAENEM